MSISIPTAIPILLRYLILFQLFNLRLLLPQLLLLPIPLPLPRLWVTCTPTPTPTAATPTPTPFSTLRTHSVSDFRLVLLPLLFVVFAFVPTRPCAPCPHFALALVVLLLL